MIKRDLFKNSFKMLALSFVTALTLTGCSIELKVPDNFSVNETKDEVIDYAVYNIAQIIDDTDLKNEDEINQIIEEINEELNNEELCDFQKATLVRVVDGDTIVVDIDGENYKVRLIGIDTPESVASQEYLDRTGKENTSEGMAASDYTKALLEDVNEVYLQKDVSDTDRYGRLLRYVWLEIPDNDYDLGEISTKMLNGILVTNHIANVATYKPDVAHSDDFTYLYEHNDEFR
jgi:endonuclease YncB( thermonuclease family)